MIKNFISFINEMAKIDKKGNKLYVDGVFDVQYSMNVDQQRYPFVSGYQFNIMSAAGDGYESGN